MKRRKSIKLMSLGVAGLTLNLPSNLFGSPSNDCLTTADIEGPYYKEGAPLLADLAEGVEQGEAQRIFITGTVYASDCKTPVANAVVDVWHATPIGEYEDNHFRGKIITDENGTYAYHSFMPGRYLNGSTFRPKHLHYKVWYQEAEKINTQIYFENDPEIPGDPWASDESAVDRIIPMEETDNSVLHGVVDVTIDVAPLSVDEFGGMIKGLSVYQGEGAYVIVELKNSMQQNLQIELYDLHGRLLDSSNEKPQTQTHQLSILGESLSTGIYIVRVSSGRQTYATKRVILR